MRRIFLLTVLCLLSLPGSHVFANNTPFNTTITFSTTVDYTDECLEVYTAEATSTVVLVKQNAAVQVVLQIPAEATTPGGTLYIPVKVTNVGNGPDIFDLTAQSNSSWGVSLIEDSNSDGIHQASEELAASNTGTIEVNTSYFGFAKVLVPGSATSGDKITVQAVSRYDSATGTGTAQIDIPPPGVTATQLTASANPLSSAIGQAVTVSGSIFPAIQRPLSISITDPDGAQNASSTSTSSDGSFQTQFTPSEKGSYRILVSFAGDNLYQSSNAGVSVFATDSNESAALSLTANPSSARTDQQVTISGTLSPAAEASVNIVCTNPAGGTEQYSVYTNASGAFSFSTSFDTEGQWLIRAECTNPSASSSTQISITEDEASDDHQIIIISEPAVDPYCVKPGDSTSCSISAIDTLNHEVTYSWSDQGAGGVFSPSANVADPTYTVPADFTDESLILVCTAACAQDPAVNVSRTVYFEVGMHKIRIITAPTATPMAVRSGGTVQCSIAAVDSQRDAINYSWSDGGAGGRFLANANLRNPVYVAPLNTTGNDIVITLTCIAQCSQDLGVSDSASVPVIVRTATQIVPAIVQVSPINGSSGVPLTTQMVIQFDSPMNQIETEGSISFSPELNSPDYAWSADSSTLTVSHQGLAENTVYTATVGTGARDFWGNAIGSAYAWTFGTTVTARFEPAYMTAPVNAVYGTSPILVTNPNAPSTVMLSVYIPETITIDETMVDDSLACVQKGDGVDSFTSQWNAETRTLTINAEVINTGVNVEVVKSIYLLAPSTRTLEQLVLNEASTLDINFGLLPGDFNGDNSITVNDASLFIQEWVRWHQWPIPSFNYELDEAYDLAPRSAGSWPNWGVFGDQTINIMDAMTFTEIWIATHTTPATSAAADTAISSNWQGQIYTKNKKGVIVVTVEAVEQGIYMIAVPVPDGMQFDPSKNDMGNLINVVPAQSTGVMLFSEYDERTRTIYITGDVAGPPPYEVAKIHLAK